MHKVFDQFNRPRNPSLSRIADQLEMDYGTAILEELTGEVLIRKGQKVRLFDQSSKSAEAYYPADANGKAYVQNFQESKRWYPVTAWMEANDLDWTTTVQNLSVRYLGKPTQQVVIRNASRPRPTPTASKPSPSVHDPTLVASTLTYYERNNLVSYLNRLVGKPVAHELIARFRVGTCLESVAPEWKHCTVYWQIDEQNRVRSGKIVYYNSLTGKRLKDPKSTFSRVQWMHDVQAMRNFTLEQCFFGLHQLVTEPKTKPIAIVESEKSALICSAFEPGFIWLASGGLSQINPDKFRPLANRQVVLFPDLGGYRQWSEKAEELRRLGYNVRVSDVIEKQANVLDRHAGLDLADFLTRYRCEQTGRALSEPDGYPALWDCESANPTPTISMIYLRDYIN